jgi:methylenetetrahydrofolate dehydrogenase (NADP+)/methenyltetrahydrofolate cyclohydrolase
MTQIISGKELALEVENELKKEVEELKKNGKTPGLVVILVGDDGASQTYVNSKIKACERLGIHSKTDRLPGNTTEEKLLKLIDAYNADDAFDGILVQLPLPKHISEEALLNRISPSKDVDCFHPENVGKLVIGEATVKPCTPAGIVELIRKAMPNTSGKHAVVLGRSNIVGKPIANMLLQPGDVGNCTVTVCHSRTANLAKEVSRADIVVAAVGRPEFVKKEMVKEGAVVIDVGINRVEADNEKGYKIVGDVDYNDVFDKVSAITPVPGGVGKMTIAMLMRNTVNLAKVHK